MRVKLRNIRYTFVLLLTLAPFSSFAHAQDHPIPPGSVLQVNSRLVVLDIAVTGKDGKLISGLTKANFHVTEDGDPQTIRSLQYTASAADPASRSKSILVLDELNNSIEETNYAKTELAHYISTLPELLLEPIMLVAVDDQGVRNLVSSTRDRQALERALHAESSRIPSNFLRHDYQARFQTTVNALWQLGHSSGGSSGRTEVIWVGRGFPSLNLTNVEGDYAADMKTLIQNLSNALLNARAVVYQVDPAPVGAGNMTTGADTFDQAFDDSVEPFSDSISFDTLVRQTGGRSFFNRNDVDAEVQSATTLGGTFYTLTYTPTHPDASSVDYRHIHVTIDLPGAHVATRQGYYVKEASTTGPDPERVIDAAIASGLDYHALRLQFYRCNPEQCTLQINPADLQWTSDPDGNRSANLLVSVASYSTARKPLSYARTPVTLRAAPSGAFPAYVSFNLPLHLSSQVTSLRVIVLDTRTGKLGSATHASHLQAPSTR